MKCKYSCVILRKKTNAFYLQKRRSSRQVKRKRYTEDLEFKISDDEPDDLDGRDSPSNLSQSEQQVSGPP